MANIFISYSHKDEAYKDHLQSHLGVLEKQGKLTSWDDRQIATGDDWMANITHSLATADVAMLLISRYFLTSDFILNKEIPPLLQRREKEGLRIIPIILSPCTWQAVDWLAAIQAYPRDNVALSSMSEHEKDEVLAQLGRELSHQHVDKQHYNKSNAAFEMDKNPVVKQTLITRVQQQNPAIKAAWIGAIAMVIAAIITGVLSLKQPSNAIYNAADGEREGNNLSIEASGGSQAIIATDNAKVIVQPSLKSDREGDFEDSPQERE